MNENFTAQDFYDWRNETDDISGNDLHESFRRIAGEPSPSGYKEVARKDAKKEWWWKRFHHWFAKVKLSN